jgi:hypothetical protein
MKWKCEGTTEAELDEMRVPLNGQAFDLSIFAEKMVLIFLVKSTGQLFSTKRKFSFAMIEDITETKNDYRRIESENRLSFLLVNLQTGS